MYKQAVIFIQQMKATSEILRDERQIFVCDRTFNFTLSMYILLRKYLLRISAQGWWYILGIFHHSLQVFQWDKYTQLLRHDTKFKKLQ